jgi:N-acetylneuraminate synthase/sialic acid synthase
MPAYKIASADLTNTPLQKEISKLKKPIFLSTGGGNLEDIKRAQETIMSINTNLSILHCTAAYPAPIEDMNLGVIKKLKENFKNCRIGLSDHENGIDAAPIAYMLGASIFEKHFTLDRAKKGTDHSFSLEPVGLAKFVRNLLRIKKMIGSSEKKLLKSEVSPLFKMKKSIVAKKKLLIGKILEYSDLDFKSPGGGLEPYKYHELVGRKLKKNIDQEEFILIKDVQ